MDDNNLYFWCTIQHLKNAHNEFWVSAVRCWALLSYQMPAHVSLVVSICNKFLTRGVPFA